MRPTLSPADRRELKGLALRLAAFALGGWLLLGVVFGVGSAPNDDMHPAMEAGDVYVYYRLQKNWRAGDLVCAKKQGHTVVGRVAAAQGDSVAITPQGQVMVNGALVLQRDASPTPAYEGGPDYPVTLGEGEVFLLCDNRRTGADSRLFGPLSANQRRGKILVILRRSQL